MRIIWIIFPMNIAIYGVGGVETLVLDPNCSGIVITIFCYPIPPAQWPTTFHQDFVRGVFHIQGRDRLVLMVTIPKIRWGNSWITIHPETPALPISLGEDVSALDLDEFFSLKHQHKGIKVIFQNRIEVKWRKCESNRQKGPMQKRVGSHFVHPS